ncbi:glycoside hydrolase family 113 [Paenibacillus sp. YYML68]|uniref:glycoside hydrolase family 113 n=1 Tax=Paenibacillus sp. YYML68 TaxID=2909250 RepID=UPI00248FAEDE|nr:hypothetical protein [Paenibacillus sp. YYML68]
MGSCGPRSESAQAAYYEAMFSDKRDWVGGFMLWDWQAHLYERSKSAADDDYCM